MKKLLVLLLVLGMTSLASAAYTLRVDRGEGAGWEDVETVTLLTCQTIKLGIHCDTAVSYLSGYLVNQNSYLGEWVNTTTTVHMPPASTDSYVSYLGMHNFGPVTWEAWDLSLYSLQGTGMMANDFIFHCTNPSYIDPEHPEWGLQNAVLQIYSDAFAKLDKVIVVQIPEPMTIALLGLGGLFLRRRK
jgi:hypothetical protein